MTPAEVAAVLQFPELPRRLAVVQATARNALATPKPLVEERVLRRVQQPGKGIRAMLLLTCAELGGVHDQRVVDAAAAVELIQTGSLIHDDITDSAPVRRGAPTLVAELGVPTALVAGDYVLAVATGLALGASPATSSRLATAMSEMAAGQLQELQDVGNVDRTSERYLEASRAKTGSLFAAACHVGGVLGGAPEQHVRALTTYGERFGTAYQLVDDLLDITGTVGARGKPAGADLPGGVYSLPVIQALRARGGKTLARLLRSATPSDIAEAYRRVSASPGPDATAALVAELAAKAAEALRPVPSSPLLDGLRRLPHAYLTTAVTTPRARPTARRAAPLRAEPTGRRDP